MNGGWNDGHDSHCDDGREVRRNDGEVVAVGMENDEDCNSGFDRICGIFPWFLVMAID